jgi:hypothetical protein
MPQRKEQLFNDFVHFLTQRGWGIVYPRDPRQDVPPDCGFIRVRVPGEVLFSSVGIVRFRTPEEGMAACRVFAERSETPLEWQMNFLRMAPQTFSSPTFAEAHALAQSRWRRWRRALGAWWPSGLHHSAKPERATR